MLNLCNPMLGLFLKRPTGIPRGLFESLGGWSYFSCPGVQVCYTPRKPCQPKGSFFPLL